MIPYIPVIIIAIVVIYDINKNKQITNMTINKVDINEVKLNPVNPRVIKDDKFKKLVKSIKEFPEMLDIRPIVVDENNIVLGGNMRQKMLVLS